MWSHVFFLEHSVASDEVVADTTALLKMWRDVTIPLPVMSICFLEIMQAMLRFVYVSYG